MENLLLIQSFFLFISVLIIIILSMMIFSLLKYKKLKNKEEYLTVINQIFTLFIIILSDVYIIFWFIGKLFLFQKILYKILNYFFNIYITYVYINNFIIILEYYYTYEYPIHYFSYLLKIEKNYKSYYYIIFLSLIIIVSLFDILYCEIKYIHDIFFFNSFSLLQCRDFKEIDSNDNKNINIFPFVLTINFRGYILILFSIITIIYIIQFLRQLNKFYFNKKNKLKLLLIIKIILNIFYLLYGILCSFFKGEIFDLLNSFLFLVIILFSNLVLIIKYALSRFALIKLNKTIIGKIGLHLNLAFNNKTRIIPLTYSTANLQSISSLLLMESPYNTYNQELNSFEQELFLMYQNDIFIEDYYLNYFDQIINIITSSLYKLYNSEIFSAKEVNNKKLKKELNISISSINGGGSSDINEINSSIPNEELLLSEYLSSFTFYKNKVINDFTLFEEVFNNSNNKVDQTDLRVNIYSYYTNSCVNNIFEKNYSSKNIANSIISHIPIKNSNSVSSSSTSNPELPAYNYYSLTASNAKEINFKNLNNICFKTYDKRYRLEIFETSETINEMTISSHKNNNNISELINKYFEYLDKKGINNTFLPLILGIFKIKINHFKSLLVIITDNSIIENYTVKNYTNWQLIRFKQKGFTKVASSRYSRNTIVEDDLIFKRVYWKENKINADLKIKLINYEDVKNIMISDINFLKNAGCCKFYLLLMYYEYESYQKKESYNKNEVIKIKSNKNNSPEIVNDILPKEFLYNDSNILSDSDDETNEKKQSNAFSRINFSSNKKNKKENNRSKSASDIKLINDISADINGLNINYNEQINLNGYNGIFDNFNCLCFFTFENIFENQVQYQYKYDFYKNYLKKIMKYFTSFKEKDKDINKGINIGEK